MLNRDEFLSEEQANPHIVEDLQTFYQLKPQEKAILARVHTRLAQNDMPLPRPVHQGDQSRSLRLIEPASPLVQTVGQKWQRHFNGLAAILIAAILVGSLLLTLSIRNHQSQTATAGQKMLQVVLVPAQPGVVLSQTELTTTRALLSQRFSSFGVQAVSVKTTTVNEQPGLLVALPYLKGNQQLIIDTLLQQGVLNFWNTDSTLLAPGASFDLTQYAQYNPNATPLFTGQDLDPHSFVLVDDSGRGTQIAFVLKGAAKQRLQNYTGTHIGSALTIVLDGKVLESAIIQAEVSSGGVALGGSFTHEQAKALVALLENSPLPVKLKQQN